MNFMQTLEFHLHFPVQSIMCAIAILVKITVGTAAVFIVSEVLVGRVTGVPGAVFLQATWGWSA
jgi:hypothetical protein